MRHAWSRFIIMGALLTVACGPSTNPASLITEPDVPVVDVGTDAGPVDTGSTTDTGPTITDTPVVPTDNGVPSCSSGQTNCSGVCLDLQANAANCGRCGNICASGQVCNQGVCITTCPPSTIVCNGGCVASQSDPRNCGACDRVCPVPTNGNAVCASGQCDVACSSEFTNCSGACRNLRVDGSNCGACGNTCASGSSCVNGACSTSCAPGFELCGNRCVTPANDVNNCGACGRVCPSGQICSTGFCQLPSCPSGQTRCGSDLCVDTNGSANNCGACGRTCPVPTNGTATCAAGACGISCNSTFTRCGDACLDVQTNPANCGVCGRGCAVGELCVAGTCRSSSMGCSPGTVLCGNFCANIQSDALNCGACGRSCATSNGVAQCQSGTCVITACQSGTSDCDGNFQNGCESSLSNDSHNCGACGRVCPSGQTCQSGSCACASGGTICGSSCVNTQNDPSNCGRCGQSCLTPTGGMASCVAGACQSGICPSGQMLCGDRCVNVVSGDALNCGACGRSCNLANANSACASGACVVISCNTGMSNCDGDSSNGCETNIMASRTNCGACGNTCASGQVCNQGACVTSCTNGLMNCGNNCVSTQTDIGHCGACGVTCLPISNATPSCTTGTCGFQCNGGFGDCDSRAANGCEVELYAERGSLQHCGGCNMPCVVGPHAHGACSYGYCYIPATGCDAGYADCDGDAANGCEVSLGSDEWNCGRCGVTCSQPSGGTGTCVSGSCTASCYDTGATLCGGSYCSNLRWDTRNCGACGRTCSLPNAFPYCSSGGCYVGACTQGHADCNYLPSDGCEVDYATDNANCGACGRVCGSGSACTNGACVATCTSGQTSCSGTCVDTNTNVAHCGRCGAVCGMGQTCTAGVCVTPMVCPTGQTMCSGICRALATDNANCGACGNVCTASQTCQSGVCTTVMMSCPSGQTLCSGSCVDTATNANNCGRCGTVCGMGQSCSSGVCAMAATFTDVYHVIAQTEPGDPARSIGISQWEDWRSPVTPVACNTPVLAPGVTVTRLECDITIMRGSPAAFNARFTFDGPIASRRQTTITSCYQDMVGTAFDRYGTLTITRNGVAVANRSISNGANLGEMTIGCNEWDPTTPCPSRMTLNAMTGTCGF